MHEPIIECKYKVIGDTRVIPIVVEHEEDKIKLSCNTSISMNEGEPETLKEAMSIPNQYLLKISDIYEVNNFLSRKACIPIKISKANTKDIKPVPVKWVFNSKEDSDGLMRLESINVVKGYIQVPGVDYTE